MPAMPGSGQHPGGILTLVAKEFEILQQPPDTGFIRQKLQKWKSDFLQLYPERTAISIDDVSYFIFSYMGITAGRDSLKISTLVKDRKGNCVTVSLLYYYLAEETPLYLKAVHAPEHFFLRTYQDSGLYLNTEPTQQGVHLADSYYVASKSISDESIRNGSFMKESDLSFLEDAYINNLAVLLQARGEYQKAINIYSASLEQFPSNPEIWVNRGDCLRNIGEYERAIEDYSKAISLYDMDPGYHERRGKAYVNAGKCRQAIEDFSLVINKTDRPASVLIHRGKAYINCQQVDKACLDWMEAKISGTPEAIDLYKKHCE
jgi:tetratricopeptide (TPR) repeat protein